MNENSFYSIDRLVEFGLGMAMAQQMIKIMNESMQTMYVPGAPQNISLPQCAPIYVAINGQASGPYNEADFTRLVSDNAITKDTLVWHAGMLGWKPLSEVPSVLKIIALIPPPLPNL